MRMTFRNVYKGTSYFYLTNTTSHIKPQRFCDNVLCPILTTYSLFCKEDFTLTLVLGHEHLMTHFQALRIQRKHRNLKICTDVKGFCFLICPNLVIAMGSFSFFKKDIRNGKPENKMGGIKFSEEHNKRPCKVDNCWWALL